MSTKQSNRTENIRSEFQKLFEESPEEQVEHRAQMLSYIFLSEAQKVMDRKGWTRKQLKKDFDFPVKQEFHAMRFLSDKDPYHGKYNPVARKEILSLFCEFMAVLEVNSINVVIDKGNIVRTPHDVLENALTYNIQRNENEMNYSDLADKDLLSIPTPGNPKHPDQKYKRKKNDNHLPYRQP